MIPKIKTTTVSAVTAANSWKWNSLVFEVMCRRVVILSRLVTEIAFQLDTFVFLRSDGRETGEFDRAILQLKKLFAMFENGERWRGDPWLEWFWLGLLKEFQKYLNMSNFQYFQVLLNLAKGP